MEGGASDKGQEVCLKFFVGRQWVGVLLTEL